jgi:hypothetical protein
MRKDHPIMSTTTTLDSASASAQLTATLPAVANSADTDSAAAVQNLGLVQQARLSSLNRAATLATAQYGKDSTQANAARNAIDSIKTVIARTQLASLQINTPRPVVAATGWALQGRVLDSNLAALPRYTVFLVDEHKAYVREYGFAYTDSTGYFLINYTPGSQGSTQGDTTHEATAATPSIFLEVANPKAEPVYLSSTAFAPVLGQATYQTVTLAAGEPILGDPPGEVKRVAMPPGTEQS